MKYQLKFSFLQFLVENKWKICYTIQNKSEEKNKNLLLKFLLSEELNGLFFMVVCKIGIWA